MACPSDFEPMGLGVLGSKTAFFRRKFQWMLSIKGLDGKGDSVIVYPRRGNRPSLGWKEVEVQHLTESVHYPFKPVWDTIDFTLFDVIECEDEPHCNPIFDWIRTAMTPIKNGIMPLGLYDPQYGEWNTVIPAQIKRTVEITVFTGCGEISDQWILENAYPQHVRWGEVDMDSSDVITVDVTLRYDRAYCPSNSPLFKKPMPVPPPPPPNYSPPFGAPNPPPNLPPNGPTSPGLNPFPGFGTGGGTPPGGNGTLDGFVTRTT